MIRLALALIIVGVATMPCASAAEPDLFARDLEFTRNLSAEQLQQVFSGVVKHQSGYTNAELDAFLKLLPSVKAGSILRLRSNAAGMLDVFEGSGLVGSIAASDLAAAVWVGLGGKV